MNKKLSICIPTYNRCSMLSETIQSIAKQIGPDVEIFVSDNGSTDGTVELLKKFEKNILNFRWYQFEKNVGFDKNLINLFRQAQGEYCWILSSDDWAESNSIHTLLQVLNENQNISGITINGRAYSFDMKKQTQISTFSNYLKLNKDIKFDSAENAFSEIGEYYGFISAQVVKKNHALNIIENYPVDNYYNGYVHVYIIGMILKKWPNWIYLSKPMIKWRSGNDSLASIGRVNRLAVDVIGFSNISAVLWTKYSKTYNHVQKRVCKFIVCGSVLETKISNLSSIKYVYSILKLCIPVYWNYKIFWIRAIPIMLLPAYILKILKNLNNKIKVYKNEKNNIY